jgi:putative holliday junction resolvase
MGGLWGNSPELFKQMEKFLGIDYGRKRIGVAVGSMVPKVLGAIQNSGSYDEVVRQIVKLAKDEEVTGIVYGLPNKADNKDDKLVCEIEKVAELVYIASGLPKYFESEVLTSVMAEEELKQRKIDFRHNKEEVDKLAAVIILTQFLEERENEKNNI